jgi:hypothetical protein
MHWAGVSDGWFDVVESSSTSMVYLNTLAVPLSRSVECGRDVEKGVNLESKG